MLICCTQFTCRHVFNITARVGRHIARGHGGRASRRVVSRVTDRGRYRTDGRGGSSVKRTTSMLEYSLSNSEPILISVLLLFSS